MGETNVTLVTQTHSSDPLPSGKQNTSQVTHRSTDSQLAVSLSSEACITLAVSTNHGGKQVQSVTQFDSHNMLDGSSQSSISVVTYELVVTTASSLSPVPRGASSAVMSDHRPKARRGVTLLTRISFWDLRPASAGQQEIAFTAA